MPRLREKEHWRPARDLPFLSLVIATAAGMVRTVDQPDTALSVAGTTVSIVPTDVAFAVLAGFCALRLLGRAALPRPARAMTAAAAALFGWLLLSSLLHGFDAFVGAARLAEYGVLALGAVLFVYRRSQLWILVGVILLATTVAAADALPEFFGAPRVRHGGSLGPHDLAALGTMSLTVGLAGLYATAPRRRLSIAAAVVGTVAVILPAAFASLLGLYIAVAAMLGLAWRRDAIRRRALAITAAVVMLVTGGVFLQRTGDIGFVHEIAGTDDGRSTASGWSQRLVYAYVGGRVFLDNPVVGTGWYGELPPEEYARYLPDARRRFPEQPDEYFPRAGGTFIPQQTYDQVLFELGLVGAALFALLAAATVGTVLRTGAAWPRAGPDDQLAYLPATWVGALAGALAGAALFGGIPLTAIFWLTLGVAALVPSLVPPQPSSPPHADRREPVLALK
jgi:hypothetical protein